VNRRERLAEEESYRQWKGGYRSYDIVKEACIALGVVVALALVLTVLFSSPDERPSTVKSWSRGDPVDFVTTAVSELDGTSESAAYGPPYNHGTGSVQHIAFIHLQQWLGVDHPINAPEDFVLGPLGSIAGQPALQSALTAYRRRPPSNRPRGRPLTPTHSIKPRSAQVTRSRSRPATTARWPR